MTALALALLSAITGAPPDSARCPGATAWERTDLDAAGVDHVSDLLRFVPDLPSYSVDGFDAIPLDGRTAGRTLRLIVDGAPAASTTSLEPLGIDGLPVAVADLARVVYCPGPGVVAGRWGGAWLEIETQAPAPHALGAVFYGNETGDPGPQRYADPSLPNVDHWGPDFEGAVVARRGALWASFRDRTLFPTDPAMSDRVFDAVVSSHYPARNVTTAQLALDVPTGRARLAYARADDLPHIPILGRELPTNRRTVQGSAALDLFSSARFSVTGVAHASQLRLARPAWGAVSLDPDWTETRLGAAVEARIPQTNGSLRTGLQADAVSGAAFIFDSGLIPVGRLYAASERRAGRAARALTLAATAAGNGAALQASLAETRPLGSADVTLTLAAETSLPEESPDLAFWTSRGYAGLNLGLVALTLDRTPGRANRLLGRLDARARLGAVTLTASAEALRTDGDVLVLRLVPAGVGFAGTARLDGAQGEALRARVGAATRVGPVALRTDLFSEGALSGNAAFRETWRRRAVLRSVSEATLRPDARLSLRARLDARTATEWEGYPEARIPPQALVDLTLVRRFWGERVRAQIVGRNVLGAPETSHPLGATLAPRLFVRLEAAF